MSVLGYFDLTDGSRRQLYSASEYRMLFHSPGGKLTGVIWCLRPISPGTLVAEKFSGSICATVRHHAIFVRGDTNHI